MALISLLPLGLHRCPGQCNCTLGPCVTVAGSSRHDYSPQRCDCLGRCRDPDGWVVREARHPTPCARSRSAEAPRTCDTPQPRSRSRRVLTPKQIQALLGTPRSPRCSTDTAISCPAWTRRSPRRWMGSDGRLSSEGIARDAMTRIRWGRVLEHAAEIGRVTVKPPPGVVFRGRDRSTHDSPTPRGCCRGTLARGYALTSSEPRRRRR